MFGKTDDELANAPLTYRSDLFHGKTVLVSGAGTGLGKATAYLFARLGARLAICGRKIEKNVNARGTDVIVVSRPERWSITQDSPVDGLALDGEVIVSAFVGSHNEYLVDVGGGQMRVWSFGQTLMNAGERVRCTISRDALLVLDREQGG